MQAVKGVLRLIHAEDLALRRGKKKAAQHAADAAVCEHRDRSLGRDCGDFFECRSGALGYHDIALAAGRLVVPMVEPSRGHGARPTRLDLHTVQAVPVAPTHFAQPVIEAVGVVRQAGSRRGDRQRLADTAQRTCPHDDARRLIADPPQLLYQDLSLAQRVMRDMVTSQTVRVLIDSRENYQKLAAFAQGYMPRLVAKIEHYTGERPLFELYNVEDEIERALSRRVELKSGGYLIIDQTEAMTTIDVNTGGFVGSRNFDDTIFKSNLEAAQAIARQLRLRNLGGIIVLDFIDMQSDQHRAAVLEEFRRALARDRTRITVNGFTALGLVEMTRKRTRESLAHVLCEPCPTCGGRGEVKTADTVCYEILREILREARAFNEAREFRILASQSVIDRFLEEEASSLEMLSQFIGKRISMQIESSYTQEQFDIVLM